MKKILLSIFAFGVVVFGSSSLQAQTLLLPTPIVPQIAVRSSTSVTVSLSSSDIATFSAEEQARTYFEYYETQQVCIMIYPTPEHCKPKKTTPGMLSVTLTGLKPQTQYTVSLKRDNTIMCVTTPCPSNEYQSQTTTFMTPPILIIDPAPTFTRNLHLGSRGTDVVTLQNILRTKGYFLVKSTGYYGFATLRAVVMYQKNDMQIRPTGTVGPLTRAALFGAPSSSDEVFSGTITAVSTACFADGECSVTVDGKKVVTTIGWSQAVVGTIRGSVQSIGDIETQKIGARANVYAKKTADGYTLYGSSNYYIEVL